MPLPKVNSPIFPILVPSQDKKFKFRQWKGLEENILLVAKESTETHDKLHAIYQIVNNCMVDVTKMTTYDLEWVFLKLREISIGPTLNLVYTDPEDELQYPVTIELSKVEPPAKVDLVSTIIVSKELSFEVEQPSAELYLDTELIEGGFQTDDVLAKSLKSVSTEDRRYDVFTLAEAKDFLLDLDLKSLEAARNVILSAPTMKYDVKYTNSKGTERTVELRTLLDFFTF